MADQDSNPVIISRKEAKAKGLKRYFTGRPCKHGHVVQRHVNKGDCVVCHWRAGKVWRAKNIERCHMVEKEYRKKNPEAHKKAKAKFNKTEHAKSYHREYKLNNKEREAELAKLRRIANPEPFRRSFAKWAKNNPGTLKIAQRRWQQKNHEKTRTYAANRRALKRGNGGSHTVDDIRQILTLQKGRCALCRIILDKKYHVDHIIPLMLGGSNDRRNLQVLCVACNVIKGHREPIEYMRSLGFLL